MILYEQSINKYKIDDSVALVSIILKEFFKDSVNFDDLKNLMLCYMEEAEKSPEDYKEKYRSSIQINKCSIYKDIEFILPNVSLKGRNFLKGCIIRFHEWFLLQNIDGNLKSLLPPVLDYSKKIYKTINCDEKLIDMINNNKKMVIDHLGYVPDWITQNDIDNANSIMKEMFGKEINKFTSLLAKKKKDGISNFADLNYNKSSSIYKIPNFEIDSFIENVIRYDSDMEYYKYIDKDKYEYIKWKENMDYAEYFLCKNITNGYRYVFNTNSQINGFLGVIQNCFKQAFEKSKYIGIYDQNKAINNSILEIKSQIDSNNPIGILSLDATKFTDRLVRSAFNEVIDLIIKDPGLNKSVKELMALPVKYTFIDNKGNERTIRAKHNATTMGMKFNSPLSTLVNVYLQVIISVKSKSKLLGVSSVGDDLLSWFRTKYLSTLRTFAIECYAQFGLEIQKKKEQISDNRDGTISYLKCIHILEDGQKYNISGIAPNLIFKRVEGLNSAIEVYRSLRKALHIPVNHPIHNFVELYYKVFKDDIKIWWDRCGISNEEQEDMILNFKDRIMNRPILFGGEKSYHLKDIESRKELVKDIFDMQGYIFQMIRCERETSIPNIKSLCKYYGVNFEKTVLYDKLRDLVGTELENIGDKVHNFLDRSAEYIVSGKGDIKSVIKLLNNLQDRKFDKYKAGRGTIDRVDNIRSRDWIFTKKDRLRMPLKELFGMGPAEDLIDVTSQDMILSSKHEIYIRYAYRRDSNNIFLMIGNYYPYQLNLKYSGGGYHNYKDLLDFLKLEPSIKKSVIDYISSCMPTNMSNKVNMQLSKNNELFNRMIKQLTKIRVTNMGHRKDLEPIYIENSYYELFSTEAKEIIQNRMDKELKKSQIVDDNLLNVLNEFKNPNSNILADIFLDIGESSCKLITKELINGNETILDRFEMELEAGAKALSFIGIPENVIYDGINNQNLSKTLKITEDKITIKDENIFINKRDIKDKIQMKEFISNEFYIGKNFFDFGEDMEISDFGVSESRKIIDTFVSLDKINIHIIEDSSKQTLRSLHV
jgi:hypothetical protein